MNSWRYLPMIEYDINHLYITLHSFDFLKNHLRYYMTSTRYKTKHH